MKKFRFLAVLALLMMFGCAKDEMLTDEQELFSVEKNNQPVIGEKRGDGGVNGWNFVEFYLTSSMVEGTYLIICPPDPPNPITGLPVECGRKLLDHGYFSGNLSGYGKINSSISTYTINFREDINYYERFELYGDPDYYALYDDPSIPARYEEYFYNVVISGTVALSVNDSFKFTITGTLWPMKTLLDTNTGIIKGSGFSGTEMVISERKGKLKYYSQIFYNCGTRLIDGTNFQGANIEETGEMSLYVNNIHF